MESSEYWRKRALKLEERANKKGEALQKQLKREYTKAAKAIREKVDSFYMRYAREQGLSYAEAIKTLSSKEAREWRKTLAEYVEEIKALPDGKTKSRLIAELDMRSYASQQDRLSTLAGQIDMEIDRLFIGAERQITATMTEVLEDGYYRKSFDLQQRAGVMSHIPRLSPEMVENVLTYPWSGSDFSTRLWNHKNIMIFNLRQTITQGLIQGQSIARMSKDLGDTLGKSYITTERLIRTETNYFHGEANLKAYRAAGVKQYEFNAAIDERTSTICRDLDGEIINVEDAQVGVNYNPMHPNCRSWTTEYDPEEAYGWTRSAWDDGEPMPADTTYEEWKKAQDIAEESSKLHRKKDTTHRKKKGDIHIVSEPEYNKIINPVIKAGATVIRGTVEVEKHLDAVGANAATIGVDVLMFRQNATISDVLEEAHHFQQNKNGLNDSLDDALRTILNEIEAKEYLISVANRYKIPIEEQEETQEQLKYYQNLLLEYYRR